MVRRLFPTTGADAGFLDRRFKFTKGFCLLILPDNLSNLKAMTKYILKCRLLQQRFFFG